MREYSGPIAGVAQTTGRELGNRSVMGSSPAQDSQFSERGDDVARQQDADSPEVQENPQDQTIPGIAQDRRRSTGYQTLLPIL